MALKANITHKALHGLLIIENISQPLGIDQGYRDSQWKIIIYTSQLGLKISPLCRL